MLAHYLPQEHRRDDKPRRWLYFESDVSIFVRALTGRTKIDTLPMKTALKRLPARFYRLDSGREPVREWLKGLDAADRRVIGEDIKDVEFSWPIGKPLVDSLGRGLWEVRSSLPHGRIARVLFCVEKDCMVLLHGFMKKTQKTPKADIDLALRRKKGAGG